MSSELCAVGDHVCIQTNDPVGAGWYVGHYWGVDAGGLWLYSVLRPDGVFAAHTVLASADVRRIGTAPGGPLSRFPRHVLAPVCQSRASTTTPPPVPGPGDGRAFYQPGDRLRLDTAAGPFVGDFEGLHPEAGWQLGRVTRPDPRCPYVLRAHIPYHEVRASGVSPPSSSPAPPTPVSTRFGPPRRHRRRGPGPAPRGAARRGLPRRPTLRAAARPGHRGRRRRRPGAVAGARPGARPWVRPGAPPNAPNSDGELVARFLLAHVPARGGLMRRINRTPNLRILRPLLDPRYRTFQGDTLDALDFRPTRRALPVDARGHDASDYANGRWLECLRRVAGDDHETPGRCLLGRPLPRPLPAPGRAGPLTGKKPLTLH